jgi:hypothetical protein
VLENNLGDLAVQLWLLLCEAATGLGLLKCAEVGEIARDSDEIKVKLVQAFQSEPARSSGNCDPLRFTSRAT